MHIPDIVHLHGYFTSYKYFDHHKEFIQNIFKPTDEIIKYIKDKYSDIDTAISIHVRRGDYTKFPDIHPTLPIEYYKNALENFPKNDSLQRTYVFSDDIEWCKQQDIFKDSIFVNEEDDIELYMMSLCENNIIANSTFSWWAAYLNKNPKRKVIYPDIWFGPKGPKYNFDDLIPSEESAPQSNMWIKASVYNKIMNITIIGIGRLGLPFALLLDRAGYNVLGIDVNHELVEQINNKTYKSYEPEVNDYLEKSNLKCTTNFDTHHSKLIYILVPTPNGGGEKFYDHSILSNVLVKLNNQKLEDKDIIIGCTIMPGYIDQIGISLLKDCKNCTLSYNPEFIAQGDIIRGFQYPDILLIGCYSEESYEFIKYIHSTIVKNDPKYCFMSPLEAEITKLTINGFITTKLSFANMISDACKKMKADPFTILDAVGSDSRIGKSYFRPGYSYGGPCFPRDTKALKLFLDQQSVTSNLLKSTSEYNEEHIVITAEELLSINTDTYQFENVCYKENCCVPIIEESPKLKIAAYLVKKGKKVIIEDRPDIICEVMKEYGNIFTYEYLNPNLSVWSSNIKYII